MFASSTAKTRTIAPNHEAWTPHGYQERAVDFLLDRGSAALFLDPGLGKTSIALEAFDILREEGYAKKMLVIAPLRVCQLVWRQEALKWTDFRHLTFTTLHGPDKKKRLKDKSDVFLINPEGIKWLADEFWGKRLPFDTVVVDELTKFKNAQSVRHKALMPALNKVKRRWGLTGSPVPNGYLDLFGQMKVLDDGAALGFYFTHFRNKYFEKDFTGFSYTLRRGATKAIEAAIKPYALRMAAEDYLSLPPLIQDVIHVEMPAGARKHYAELKKEMIVELEGGDVEAGNAAAVYSKLKQMANGAVYSGDGIMVPKKTIHLHDAKLEALQDLVESLAGTPILVAYEFKHDLVRLRKAFPNAPFLGGGVSSAKAQKIEKDWNANKLEVLLAHPQSAGHGLNFQRGNASHIAWFSVTWDYELYDQFIRRVFRQGNKAARIVNHVFIVDNTIDDQTVEALGDKGFTQNKFFKAMNAEIYDQDKTDAAPNAATTEPKESNMPVRKLRRKSRAEEPEEVEDDIEEDEQEEAPQSSRRSRRSERKRQAVDDDDNGEAEDDGQDDDDTEGDDDEPRRGTKRRIQRKLRGKAAPEAEDDDDQDDDDTDAEPVSRRARRAFSKGVQEKLDDAEDDEGDDDDQEDEVEKPAPKRSRRKTKTVDEDEGGIERVSADDAKPLKGVATVTEDAPPFDDAKINYDKLAAAILRQFGKALANL